MGEAKTVLWRRKCEIEREIIVKKIKEKQTLRELNAIRDIIILKEKSLKNILDVYNRLID